MTEEQLRALEAVFGTAQGQTQGISRAQQDILDQILAGEQAQSVHNVPAPNPAPDTLRALGHGAVNGATLGFADNILGGMAVVAGRSPDGSRLGDYSDPGASYAAMRDQARADLATDRERQPGAALTGELAGGTLTAAVATPRLVGETFLNTAGRMLGFGAAEGAAQGAGNSDAATWGGLGQAALIGAGIGAGLGAAAPAGAVAARTVADPLVGAYKALRGTPYEGRAARALFATFRRAGKTPEEAARVIQQAAAEGQGAFMTADALGYSGQRALAGVARQPGEGREEIAAYLRQRQLDQPDRVSGFVDDALGTRGTTARRETARLEGVREAEADDPSMWARARAEAGPVDVRDALNIIDGRIGPLRDSELAPSGIDLTMQSYRNRIVPENPTNGPAAPLADFSRLHALRKDLNDDIGAAVRNNRGQEAAQLIKLRDALDASMEQAAPTYRTAREAYAARSRAIEAVETGRAAPQMRHEDAIDTFRALPQAQPSPVPGQPPIDPRQAFRSGYADPAQAAIDRATPGRNAALPFTSTRSREVMKEIGKDPARFQRQIDRENTMTGTAQAALGGSKTADNLADQVDMNGTAQGLGVLQNILSQRYGAAGADLIRMVGSAGTGLNEETRTLIARTLLSKDPQAAMASLLRRAARDGEQMRAVEGFLRSLGYNAAQGRLPQ